MTHRVKNTLSVVQSIAHLSLRNSGSPDEFVTQFDGRLAALAKSHGLLVESDWQGVDLAALTRQQLEPYMVRGQDRLNIEGEPVTLPPDLASPFGLVLHELATNAAKHGALSLPAGKIFLSWSISNRNQKQILKFVWKELGGPQVKEPDHVGYGTGVIDRGVPDAVVNREFSPQGMVFTIEFPLKAERLVNA